MFTSPEMGCTFAVFITVIIIIIIIIIIQS